MFTPWLAGEHHTLLLAESGGLWAFGGNRDGQVRKGAAAGSVRAGRAAAGLAMCCIPHALVQY